MQRQHEGDSTFFSFFSFCSFFGKELKLKRFTTFPLRFPPKRPKQGEGVAHFRAGHKYAGGFKEGKMFGKGRYEWTDGIVYEGEFRDNVAHGHGSYTWPDG